MKTQCHVLSTATTLLLATTTCFADITSNLVAYWNFENCNTQDSSGNGNNGTSNSGVSCVDGISGKGMQFDGATGYIVVPNSPSLNPTNYQWSMSFWINITDVNNDWSPIFHKGGAATWNYSNREYSIWAYGLGHSLWQTSAGNNSFELGLGTPSVNYGEWIHYVGVIDRVHNVTLIYLNGQKVSEIYDYYTNFNINTDDLWIGGTAETNSTYSPLHGILDEIRLYDRALSASDIAQLYNANAPVSGTMTGLANYSVECKNISTKKTVIINKLQANYWDCAKAGLKVTAGQKVEIEISGTR